MIAKSRPLLILTAYLMAPLMGTTYTWLATTNTTNYWTNSANWSPVGYPNAVDDVADFNVDVQTDIKVFVDTPITVGSILMGDTTPPFCNTYLYQKTGGQLTYSVSSGKALIASLCTNAPCQSQVVVDAVLASDLFISNPTPTASIWFSGDLSESGTRSLTIWSHPTANVNLYGANTFTGGTTILDGFVSFFTIAGTAGNPLASPLGKGTAPTTLFSGGLKPHFDSSVIACPNALVFAGDVTFGFSSKATNLLLTGPILLSNGTRTVKCEVATNIPVGGVRFAGPIGDAGSNYGLIFAGPGHAYLSATNTYGGDTVIQNGVVHLGTTNAMPQGPGKGNLCLLPGTGTNARFDLNGYATVVSGLSNGGGGNSVIDNLSNAPAMLTFGSNDQPCFYTGSITNKGAALTLLKIGTNRAVFSNATVYTTGGLQVDGDAPSALELAGNTTWGPGPIRVGMGSPGATLFISGNAQVTADYVSEGNINGNGGHLVQTGGVFVDTGGFRVGQYPNLYSTNLFSGGTLTLVGTVTNNPVDSPIVGVLYVGLDGNAVFNQTGGTLNAGALVLDGRNDTPPYIDTYVLAGGTLNLTSPWGISGNPSARFILGNGTLNPPPVWTNGSPLVLAFTGTQTLTGVHTNNFPIILSNGTLNLLGNLASGTGLVVTNGATLSGSGTIAGPLTVAAGSVLAPGSNAANLGTLTAQGLALANTSVLAVELNGSGPACDAVVATGTMACAGTLVVSNLTNPVTGSVFPILQAPSVTGTFAGLVHGTFFSPLGRVFLIEYTATNVLLIDQGPNSGAPQVSLLNPNPYAPTNGVFSMPGVASNLNLPNEAPSVYVSTNGGAASFLAQATVWTFPVDASQYPEGTNVFVFTATSSNGTTNRTFFTNVIDRTTPGAPQTGVAASNFDGPFPVVLTAADAYGISLIYYTLDGSVPTRQSSAVTNGGSVLVSNTCTLTALAYDRAGNAGPANQVVYTRFGNTQGGGVFTAILPNPRKAGTEPVMLTFRRSTLVPVDLVILDLAGRAVAELPSSGATGNYLLTWTWDGRRMDGSPAGRGMYRVMPRVGGSMQPDLARRIYIQ